MFLYLLKSVIFTFELMCDLDLWDIDVILSRDTPSNDGEQMYQMILKSNNKWHSYGPDKESV